MFQLVMDSNVPLDDDRTLSTGNRSRPPNPGEAEPSLLPHGTHRGYPSAGVHWVPAVRQLALLKVAPPEIVQDLTLRGKGNGGGVLRDVMTSTPARLVPSRTRTLLP